MRNIGGEDLITSGIHVPEPYQLHTATVNRIENQFIGGDWDSV